jgi:hypothetical protein
MFLFALLGFAYIALLVGFWSLCRMSAMQPRPWTRNPEEESLVLVPCDSMRREATVKSLELNAGRTIGA